MAAGTAMMYSNQAAQSNNHQSSEDQYLTTFFCRALYDYQSQDASSLSFYRGDIIEVLSQLETGWWDGLLNDERGWFPSNYVQPISDQEAESELAPSEYSTLRSDVHDSAIDVSQNIDRRIQAENDQEWLRDEMEYSRGGLDGLAHASLTAPTPANDFWVPQVTSDGQIYYVNTKTGEQSRDLPLEVIDDASDVDLAGLTSTNRSRAGSSAGLGIPVRTGSTQTSPHLGSSHVAGFGVERRTGTPEPWIKRLADDGMSYYYLNRVDGQVQWTRPTAERGLHEDGVRQTGRRPTMTSSSTSSGFTATSQAKDILPSSSRLRSGSTNSQPPNTSESSKRLSVYSDDSDVQPRDLDRPARPFGSMQSSDSGLLSSRIPDRIRLKSQTQDIDEEEPFELTASERTAMQLQAALAPSEPESIEGLSERVREAIIGVMHSVDDNGLRKSPNQDKEVEENVAEVIVTLRNLLYISCALSSPLPNDLGERDTRDPTATAAAQQLQSHLKTSQRKVTATLSKLVLSARAARFKRELLSTDMMIRVEQDAADLQRAVDSFVLEVQKQYARTAIKQLHARVGQKRLRGVFGLANIGMGLPGSGAAGSWRGLGYIGTEDGNPPKRSLSLEVLSETKICKALVEEKLSNLYSYVGNSAGKDMANAVAHGQEALVHLSSFLTLATDINVAQHVDVDGIHREQGGHPSADTKYSQAVDHARALVRNLELLMQNLFDGGATILLTLQAFGSGMHSADRSDKKQSPDILTATIEFMRVNLRSVQEVLEGLLNVGQDQADAGNKDYSGSIEWRMSRLSILDGSRPASNFFGSLQDDGGGEDFVDMAVAFRKTGSRPPLGPLESTAEESSDGFDVLGDSQTLANEATIVAGEQNGVPHNGDQPDFSTVKALPPTQNIEEDPGAMYQEKRALKIRKIFGDDAPERYIDNANADAKPWYLRSNYGPDDILINPDGGIRGGTLSALVERLTTHEYGDPIYIKTFLMTYKSFTTLDELFECLVQRYRMQPPDGLKPKELEEWTRVKQTVVRIRVLNTFKNMLTDEDVLEKDDMYILDRIKEFSSNPEVSKLSAAKHLLSLIDRAKSGGDSVVKMTAITPTFPPQSIVPKVSSRKFKLLDIDPLEMARQLTIMESRMYNKIRAIECIQRGREQKAGDHHDHITDVIQLTNKIANWVANTVLSKEDSRKRAAIVKQFISIADRCRTLHNFSSMAAITSGLNSPPIRRLRRTWEQVNSRFMSQLGTCEMTLDTAKNFTNYRATLAKVNPPCVPFIGVYLTVLIFIQGGGPDILPGNLINFGKRQKASEVIREIKHWQSKPFNLSPLPAVLAFVEEALGEFHDMTEWSEYFWNLSLEREPREREDEKMARLLQESGFL